MKNLIWQQRVSCTLSFEIFFCENRKAQTADTKQKQLETKTSSTYRVRETHGPGETKSNFQEHWEVFSVPRRNLGSVWQVDIS
jgi:hypothetical protein